jgi:hypothetical protein
MKGPRTHPRGIGFAKGDASVASPAVVSLAATVTTSATPPGTRARKTGAWRQREESDLVWAGPILWQIHSQQNRRACGGKHIKVFGIATSGTTRHLCGWWWNGSIACRSRGSWRLPSGECWAYRRRSLRTGNQNRRDGNGRVYLFSALLSGVTPLQSGISVGSRLRAPYRKVSLDGYHAQALRNSVYVRRTSTKQRNQVVTSNRRPME